MSALAKAGMFCFNCYFFDAKGAALATSDFRPEEEDGVGTCQRMPPMVNQHGASIWPTVNRVRGCGDWVSEDDSWWDEPEGDGPGAGEEVPAPTISLAAVGGKQVQ